MIGIINDAIRLFIVDTYGADFWNMVAESAQVDKSFVSTCPYSDESTYKILGAVAALRGDDLEDVLQRAGFYFNTSYIKMKGYDRLLSCMGSTLPEFLQNLNLYHVHLSLTFKLMKPPSFSVSEVTPESLVFHYSSTRPGLTSLAVGLIRGAAKHLFGADVSVAVLQRREEGGADCDHDTMLVRYPHQPLLAQQCHAAATCRLALDPAQLFKLFPFHMVLDSECRLVQAGRALTRLYPGMKPGRKLTEFFELRHPYIPVSFERMSERCDSVFVLRSCSNGMELKGQMHALQMPTGGEGESSVALPRYSIDPAGPSSTSSRADPGSVSSSGGVQHMAYPAAATAAPRGLNAVAEWAREGPARAPAAHAADTPDAAQCPHLGGLWELRGSSGGPASGGRYGPACATSSPAAAADRAHRTGPAGCPWVPHQAQSPTPTSSGLGLAPQASPAACSLAEGPGPTPPPAQPSASRRSSSSGLLPARITARMAPGVGAEPVLLFLAAPRIGNMEELRSYGLYVSDLPVFDNSRELVLLAEQRTAEAALKDTFERLSVQLEEERQRSDALLYQMIPPHIAETLRRGQRAGAETYPEATVLFSDVVDFTRISAASTAMEVCNMLDDLYNEFDTLLDKYPQIYKVETIGDAYMLVCNVTQPCVAHVDTMLDFALEMQSVCSRVTTNRGAPIQIRVGVHTGSVVGGVVGRRMPRFHLFGDTVNTASRMESHGVGGTVHISAASRALIRRPSLYFITGRGEIAVKGKGLMETFLVSRAGSPSRAHLLALLEAQAPDTPAGEGELGPDQRAHLDEHDDERGPTPPFSTKTQVPHEASVQLMHASRSPHPIGYASGGDEAALLAALPLSGVLAEWVVSDITGAPGESCAPVHPHPVTAEASRAVQLGSAASMPHRAVVPVPPPDTAVYVASHPSPPRTVSASQVPLPRSPQWRHRCSTAAPPCSTAGSGPSTDGGELMHRHGRGSLDCGISIGSQGGGGPRGGAMTRRRVPSRRGREPSFFLSMSQITADMIAQPCQNGLGLGGQAAAGTLRSAADVLAALQSLHVGGQGGGSGTGSWCMDEEEGDGCGRGGSRHRLSRRQSEWEELGAGI